jgi:hypothetical protein
MLKKSLLRAAVALTLGYAGAVAAHADQFTYEYPDDGSVWYYIDDTTATCQPLPDYISTPLKYAGWIHENNGQVNDFQVMPNNAMGHWVEFSTVSSSGFKNLVNLVQPLGDCQTVLTLQVQAGVLPNAPGN